MIRSNTRAKRTYTLSPYTTHFRSGAKACQIRRRRIAPQAQSREGCCRGKKWLRDRRAGINQEDRRQRQAHHRGIGPEHRLHCKSRKPVYAKAHHHDEDKRGEHDDRSEEHTSELQSLMRISYAVFCLKKKKKQ